MKDPLLLELALASLFILILIKKRKAKNSASIIYQGWGPLPLEQKHLLGKKAEIGFLKRLTSTVTTEESVAPHLKIGENILGIARAEIDLGDEDREYFMAAATSYKRLFIFDPDFKGSKGLQHGRIYTPTLGDQIIKIEVCSGFAPTKNITIRTNNGQETTFYFVSQSSAFFDALKSC